MSTMNEIGERIKPDITQSFLPLEEWTTLSFFYEREQIRNGGHETEVGSENSSPRNSSNDHPLDVEKRSRQQRLLRVVSVAKKLVDCLIRHDGDSSENAADSGGTSILQAEDISSQNIIVFPTTFDVENEDSMTRSQISASEIIDKCSIVEIKTILDSFNQMDFMASNLRHKNKLDGNNTSLQSDYFRKIGILLFNLLIPENLRNPSLELESPKYGESSRDNNSNSRSDYRDEEEPGSEKGRRKHTVIETCKNFKRVSISTVEEELQQYLLPKSICRLVSDLVEAGLFSDKTPFDKLRDVSTDLSQMMEDPQRFLFNENIAKDGLEFKDDLLCGRNSELVQLLSAMAVARMESNSFISSIITIGGEPGVGKSHLLRSVQESLTRNGWTCLQCKFDRQSQKQSCSVVSMAFDNFFQHIAALKSRLDNGEHLDSEEDLLDMIMSIEDNLNATGIVTLSAMIPSFRAIFPDLFTRVVEDDDDVISIESNDDGSPDIVRNGDNSDSANNDEEDCLEAHTFKSRFHYLFMKLVHSISNPESPMLFVLDDLQWADRASLDLISSLVMSNRQLQLMGDGADDSPHCLVVAGTYRSDEIDTHEVFGDLLRSDTVRVTNIDLAGMDIAGTNAMLSYTLQLPLRLIRELACVVHAKTLGNPLFVKEFMNSLVSDKELQYNLVEERWTWDIDAVKSKSVDVSVAEIMTRKVLHMPKEYQYALSVASCFGMRVGEEFLQLLETSKTFRGLVHSLEQIVTQEGMIQKNESSFVFQHDLIQQAVYNLIDSKERDELHYNIGVQLLKSIITSTDYSVDRTSLLAIDQINVASSIVTEASLRSPLALLNLSASQHMIELAKPVSALLYVRHGLRHLGPDGWVSNFDVCLRLHDAGCLSSYLNGMPRGVEAYIEEIMKNTKDMMDRMKSIYVLIRTLGTSGRQEVAVEKAFHFLGLLGEDFPDDVSLTNIQSALASTKTKLAKYSHDRILTSLPRLTDEKKHWAMVILAVILPYVYTVCPNYIPLIACRMVDTSLASGLCRESASGFFHVGVVSIGYFGEVEYGYQLSKLSLSILKLFNARSLYPKMKCLMNGYVSFWVEPLQSTAMSLAESYEEALMVGDVEYAMIGSTVSCMQNIVCGRELLAMEKEMDALATQMAQMNQTYNLFGLISMHKAVCTLTGTQKDPFRASIIPMKDEDEVVSKFSSARPSLVQVIYFHQIFVAIFCFRYEVVLNLSREYQSISQRKATTHDIFVVFFQGLSSFRLNRMQQNSPELYSMGMDVLRQFQSWVTHSEWNFENKLLLLEAEVHFSKGEHDLAEEKYLAAIESARKHRFVHEEGLSNELLSTFYESRGEDKKGQEFMMNAILCYRKWGAYGLLAQPRFQDFNCGKDVTI